MMTLLDRLAGAGDWPMLIPVTIATVASWLLLRRLS